MTLTLTVTSYQSLSPDQEATKAIDRRNATIGRGEENDWVLPDPENVLSKRHCVIEYRNGAYYLTDTSTNGVFVNQSPHRVARGQSIQLNDGDQLNMGDYLIQAGIDTGADMGSEETLIGGGPSDSFPPPEAMPSPVPQVDSNIPFDDPFADAMTSKDALEPDEPIIPPDIDLLNIDWSKPTPPPQSTEPDRLPPERAFFQPPKPAPDPLSPVEPAAIPDDWDSTLSEKAPPQRQPNTVSPLPTEPPQEAPLVPDEPQSPQTIDSASVTSPPKTRVESPPQPTSEPAPEAADSPPGPPPPPEPTPQSASDSAAGLQAFLQGAGLPPLPIQEAELPAFMHNLGQMFRLTVQGMMEVLMARGIVKRDIGSRDVTMLRPTANNPLKFSLSVDDAMINLLTKRGSAYLPPLQALQEGFNDIRAHELAMMAGLQAALDHLLQRFDPKILETRLGHHSMLDNILPGSRKARYWDLFNALYTEIAREAEDDFQELFGKEFARAYEEQVRKLNS